jgi:hypothetical protein
VTNKTNFSSLTHAQIVLKLDFLHYLKKIEFFKNNGDQIFKTLMVDNPIFSQLIQECWVPDWARTDQKTENVWIEDWLLNGCLSVPAGP